MKIKTSHVHFSLAKKLGIGILPFVILVFVVALGYLFQQTRRMLRADAIERASFVLNNTSQGVHAYLNQLEAASRNRLVDSLATAGSDSLNRETVLSSEWLAEVVSDNKPYENSYFLVLDNDGTYLLHPDSLKLRQKTVFDDADPTTQTDVIAVGHEMLAGKRGYIPVEIDGASCLVFYQPLDHTSWSIALVCRESDIFSSYYRFLYVVLPLLVAGLLLLLFFLREIVNFFTKPLKRLEKQTRYIADGHFDEPLPQSKRVDSIGRLQNSFCAMQQSLAAHVSHLQQVNTETEQRNAELVRANALAEESAQRQIAFLQDILHQVRTPLNIIMGFVQLLRDDYQTIPKEELQTISDTMQHNTIAINRMVDMLQAASAMDMGKQVECTDVVRCLELAEQAESIYYQRQPHSLPLKIEAEVPADFAFRTNRDYLLKTVNELLCNAQKFTTEGCVTLRIQSTGQQVRFVIEDTGPGISEADRDRIFNPFIKVNSFSEGLGLGLFLARQFAAILGGTLELDAAYTSGARFVLELPAAGTE